VKTRKKLVELPGASRTQWYYQRAASRRGTAFRWFLVKVQAEGRFFFFFFAKDARVLLARRDRVDGRVSVNGLPARPRLFSRTSRNAPPRQPSFSCGGPLGFALRKENAAQKSMAKGGAEEARRGPTRGAGTGKDGVAAGCPDPRPPGRFVGGGWVELRTTPLVRGPHFTPKRGRGIPFDEENKKARTVEARAGRSGHRPSPAHRGPNPLGGGFAPTTPTRCSWPGRRRGRPGSHSSAHAKAPAFGERPSLVNVLRPSVVGADGTRRRSGQCQRRGNPSESLG